MISLTDFALFQKITEITGYERGVWSSSEPATAFRNISHKYGALEIPAYSLIWTTGTRDDTRFNRPQSASGGIPGIVMADKRLMKRIRMIPVDITYELGLFHHDNLELINTFRDLFMFSTEPQGNGIKIPPIPELGLPEIGIPLTMELSINIEKSDSQEQDKYYSGTMTFVAHTWFATGLDAKAIRRIAFETIIETDIPDLYASVPGSPTPVTVTSLSEQITAIAAAQQKLHAPTHEKGGKDPLTAQKLVSGLAPAGKLMITDGQGGWTLIDQDELGILNAIIFGGE